MAQAKTITADDVRVYIHPNTIECNAIDDYGNYYIFRYIGYTPTEARARFVENVNNGAIKGY